MYQTLLEKYKKEQELFCGFLKSSESGLAIDNSTSNLILHCIDIAHHKILNYMRWKQYDDVYILAKVTLAMAYFNFNKNIAKSMSDNQTLSSFTEGNRSESYKDVDIVFDENGLTAEVRAMLPRARIQVI